MPDFTVRSATPDDARLVAIYIGRLAEFEHLSDSARPNLDDLRRQLQPHATPRLYCFLANEGTRSAGFAIGYLVYSTFLTCWNFHLEDIYVEEDMRAKGVGKALFRAMCSVARELGCERLDLEVLDWNSDAAAAYSKWGGVEDKMWSRFRFDKETMATHAAIDN